jgi:choline dehydrogenase-like flavoprotein
MTGFSLIQTYNREGVRYSTARGYLRPILERENLEIMVMSRATKVNMI